MKVVINDCYGGFGLSIPAMKKLLARKNITGVVFKDLFGKSIDVEDDSSCGYAMYDCNGKYFRFDYERNDTDLVAVVEELGDKANGFASDLKIVDIPDDVEYTIEEYDGSEWVSEVHRTWR